MARVMRGSFCERREAPKGRFDRRSFRWKKSGRAFVLVGCPRGEWNARAGRCKVGTRAYKILAPAPRGRCPTGRKVRK